MKIVTKRSGEQEPFNPEKFSQSLHYAGAPQDVIKRILSLVMQAPNLYNTADIYKFAFEALRKTRSSLAARYDLKQALYELGPAGFPFEQFVAAIFHAQGFTTKTDQIINGLCVEHEIDVIATSKDEHHLVECKFHNVPVLKTNVKTALYVKARYDDLRAQADTGQPHSHRFHHGWLVTNNKFTTQAIKYALCTGLRLLGWGYPAQDNIGSLIDRHCLYPITCLTGLNREQKRQIIAHGTVMAKDLVMHHKILRQIGITQQVEHEVLTEAGELCTPY